jgi:hypothetical protein
MKELALVAPPSILSHSQTIIVEYMSQIKISQLSKMLESIPEKVKRRRHLDQIRTADHASRFSGTERLLIRLVNLERNRNQ